MEIFYDPNVPAGNNNLPERKNVRKKFKLFVVMTLNLLVEDVMKRNKTETCAVYFFNSSSMNGIGNCGSVFNC